MKQIQLLGLTPEENNKPIIDYIDKKFNELKTFYEPKKPSEFLTRHQVAEMLHCDVSSVHNMTVKNILVKWQVSGKILYKRQQVLDSIIKIKNK